MRRLRRLWQQQWLQGDVFSKQLGYWKQQLSGELPMLELPCRDRSFTSVARQSRSASSALAGYVPGAYVSRRGVLMPLLPSPSIFSAISLRR